jgi:TPR repeat protein
MAVSGYADAPVRLHQDVAKGRTIADVGCRKGHLPSCRLRVSFDYDYGQPATPSSVQWRDLCTRGDQESCSFLAISLLNEEKNAERVLELLQRGCEADEHVACRELGYLNLRGQLLARDDTAAFRYFSKSCARDDQEACAMVGHCLEHGLGAKIDTNVARERYRLACARGIKVVACQSLARMGDRPPTVVEH